MVTGIVHTPPSLPPVALMDPIIQALLFVSQGMILIAKEEVTVEVLVNSIEVMKEVRYITLLVWKTKVSYLGVQLILAEAALLITILKQHHHPTTLAKDMPLALNVHRPVFQLRGLMHITSVHPQQHMVRNIMKNKHKHSCF